MSQNQRSKLDTEYLYSKIKYRHQLSQKLFREKHPKEVSFLESKGIKPEKIREHAAKLLTSGVLASSLLFASPKIGNFPLIFQKEVRNFTENEINKNLSIKIKEILPKKVVALSDDQEIEISHLLFNTFGVSAVSKMGSTKLNNIYGLIGAEQHLPRFPGDSISQHDEYQKSGITPGLGAWGYFARSKKELTPELIMKEKYYVAVQTMYLSDWNKRTKFLSDWYKYRKVIVVNPMNGKSIVAVVADAGPANWTGKHFGGSPEVMAYLGLNIGMQKGPVILYFIDDPDNKVPLGPLAYNLNSGSQLLTKR